MLLGVLFVCCFLGWVFCLGLFFCLFFNVILQYNILKQVKLHEDWWFGMLYYFLFFFFEMWVGVDQYCHTVQLSFCFLKFISVKVSNRTFYFPFQEPRESQRLHRIF